MKKLFYIEGVDGVGKTSLIKELLQLPAPNGWSWYHTSEPVNPPSGLLRSSMSLALHYNLDRRLHLEVISTLPDNTIIICDRGPLSTLAYQGGHNGVNVNDLTSLHHIVTSEFSYVYDFHHITLKLPLAEVLSRIAERDGPISEEETQKVTNAWFVYAARTPRLSVFGTEHVVDANCFMHERVKLVYDIINEALKGN